MSSPADVRVLVITGFGLNCETETAAAFKKVGASCDQVHLNDLIDGKFTLDGYHILAFIGGFSFGDHIGSGTVFANRVKCNLQESLKRFIEAGKLVIGICNGLQTLTRLGIVPALNDEFFSQTVALAHNDCGTFRDDWVTMLPNTQSPCIWTKNLKPFKLPVRHGEGKFVTDPETLAEIESKNLVALRYGNDDGSVAESFPQNPNGALHAIAGICNESGRIFGLMPHPEAYLSPYNAPDWTTRRILGTLPSEGDGVAIFRNGVEFAVQNLL